MALPRTKKARGVSMAGREQFFDLIEKISSARDGAAKKLEQRFWRTFGVKRAVLALDMSHFSLGVRRHGVVWYLQMIYRMHSVCTPIVEKCRGQMVNKVADNLMAVFGSCDDAVDAALKINKALELSVPVERSKRDNRISVSIGIDYGRFLMIPGNDCYGDAVNGAYKLAEDVAASGEILVTEAVCSRICKDTPYTFTKQNLVISGVPIAACRVTATAG